MLNELNIVAGKGLAVVTYQATGAPLTGSILGSTLGPVFGIPVVWLLIILVAIPFSGYSYREYVLIIFRFFPLPLCLNLTPFFPFLTRFIFMKNPTL